MIAIQGESSNQPLLKTSPSSSRPSYFFSPRLSRSQFSCTTVFVANLAKELDAPPRTSSSAQSHSTGPQDALHFSQRSSTANLDPHDYCRHARSRDSGSAIDALRRCLSVDNVTSDHPHIYSPTIIRSLYYQAESRNQLRMLDSQMLTLLIGLFGSLSHPSLVYRVPLASRLLEVSTRRTHWAFVLKVGKYKLESGMPLHDSDRFWLMRAELAISRARSLLERKFFFLECAKHCYKDPTAISRDAYSAILRARVHYHVIRRHSRHPEVHAHYLETLLAIRDPRLLDLAARDLSFLLRTYHVCHPWLQGLLYRLVVQHGGDLSTRSREVILAALWSRVRQGTEETFILVPESGVSDVALGDCNVDATTIARSVSATLFGIAGHFLNDKPASLPSHLLSVFRPTYTLLLRWDSLVLLSIFNSSEMLHLTRTDWTNDHAMYQVTSCWQVIFGLANLENVLQERSSAPEMRASPSMAVLEVTRTLYREWLSITKSCLISRDLACAVATSFLRVASILADATLFYDCQDLYRVENNSEGLQISAPKFFAAQYIAAAVRIQGAFPDVVLSTLGALSPDPKQQHQALASAVEVLTPIDASLAHALYVIGQAEGTEPDLGVIHTLAVSLAHHGALRQAVLFLNDGRFSLQARGILVSVIAHSLRENPRAHHPSSVFAAIVEGLVALYQSHVPPEHFRGHLEQLFIVLAQHGRGSQALPVVLSIFRRLPGFFQPRFFDRYCRTLIWHRQISTAGKLLDAITAVHPKIARSLCILSDRIALQTKASRAFKRAPLCTPASLKLSSRLRRRPYAGPPLEPSLRELLNSGRVLAAKHIFACVAVAIPPNRRTTLGNILVHGVSRQPTPRNGRRVRKVLSLIENLVKNHGFRPDRVTVNILIKVMINWRSAFDSPRLRDLFDQLVRGGFPTADYSPLHPPFDTRQTQFSSSSSFSKLPPFVSFERHSRPLFKMFIRAFYSCNDVEAARKVVGILKVEEYKNAVAKEARRDARSRGRIKAARRNVIVSPVP